ncbi:hypothetical protein [Chryseobacterium indologenes]|uniref:DNA-binding protein n=1 Tax=Chryseobacterium indologenes TaxID=253 RepID=A0A0N0ZWV4_CHRID|nr:hypothetical protein [Chryseobacterium indologenes]KPE51260.1 hypothetical protein AOB46_11395 [Chryseobacterium indologenes]
MDELLRKRTADLLVIDMMEAAYRIERVKKITLTFEEFCRVIGKDRSSIHKLLKNKLLPEGIILGGYENRKQKTKVLFDTEKVLEWLRNQMEAEFPSKRISI